MTLGKGNSGHTEWVEAAVQEYEGQLIRYACSFLRDLDRARDVVQETFLRLCRQDPARVDGHLAEWLFAVCRHRALDVIRKESRMTPLDEPEQEARADDQSSPEVVVEQQEQFSQVLQLLERLSANQQEVIRLKFQSGLSYKEISRITNLSVTNVGFLIHTGLKKLRQQMMAANDELLQ